MANRCAVPGCRDEVEIIYLDRGLCDRHWNELMADDASRTRLRMGLGLDTTTSPAREGDMSETTAAEGAAEETTVAKKSKKGKPAKTTKLKAAKAKAPKPKRESGPKPDRTFAIRITGEELAAIHNAAGPRNATRFVRAVAAAFAHEDEAAFRSVLKEAREARG
jgi:hypothetical protein